MLNGDVINKCVRLDGDLIIINKCVVFDGDNINKCVVLNGDVIIYPFSTCITGQCLLNF